MLDWRLLVGGDSRLHAPLLRPNSTCVLGTNSEALQLMAVISYSLLHSRSILSLLIFIYYFFYFFHLLLMREGILVWVQSTILKLHSLNFYWTEKIIPTPLILHPTKTILTACQPSEELESHMATWSSKYRSFFTYNGVTSQ